MYRTYFFVLLSFIMLDELKPSIAFCQLSKQRSLNDPIENQSKRKRAYVKKDFNQNRVGLLGSLNYFGSGLGVGYDRVISSNFHIGISAIYSQARLEGETAIEAKEFLYSNMTRISLAPRIFVWEIFYIGAGFNLSKLDGEFGFKGPQVITQNSSEDFNGLHMNADVVIGIDWDFSPLFLTMDVVGLSFYQLNQLNIKNNPTLEQDSLFITGESVKDRITSEINSQTQFTYLTIRFGYQF